MWAAEAVSGRGGGRGPLSNRVSSQVSLSNFCLNHPGQVMLCAGKALTNIGMYRRVQLLSHVQLFVTPRTVAHQAPLSMEFSKQRIPEWVAISSSRASSGPRG
ncbi:unnamed protein product [Rangifer tarandus platyrhynchus]|uniref:Uncharacterized protein n=1 Tax=Rangifer tarandus platyrhynchus TaxID=3082113 RepID=A0AC59ZUE3_RANTA